MKAKIERKKVKAVSPTPLSDFAYRKAGGGICPICKGGQIEGGSLDVDGPACFQVVSCLDCGGEWRDRYVLSSYELTRGGEKVAQFARELA